MKEEYNFSSDIDDILAEFLNESGESSSEEAPDFGESNVFFVPAQEEKKQEKAPEEKKYIYRPKQKRRGLPRFFRVAIGIGMLILSLVLLRWTAISVHPGTSAKMATDAGMSAALTERISQNVYNAKATALHGLAQIRKIYKIPESAVKAPEPNPSAFGTVSVENAEAVMNVIDAARRSGLLAPEEEFRFNPNADFYWDSDIRYYLDDSILAVCWKEVIDGNTCSLSEIKVADASQFRRKFVNDTFSADAQDFASNIAASVNAVVAMNADFYAFRDFGIVVYQRQLFRMNEETYLGSYRKYNCVDTLLVDDGGEFIFFHRGEETTPEALEKMIADRNILFSVSFGPVLVENGQLCQCDSYPAGEVNTGYSRAGIGQLGKLHYLYMSLNHSPEKAARWTVNEFAGHFCEKGVINAYCLDGGQTSEIVFQGVPYNYIDFNAERTVTDIMYFASAIPFGEEYQ